MSFKTTATAIGVTIALGGLAQPAAAVDMWPSTPTTTNARVSTMMNRLDRFEQRRDTIESSRYYVMRQKDDVKVALRADRRGLSR